MPKEIAAGIGAMLYGLLAVFVVLYFPPTTSILVLELMLIPLFIVLLCCGLWIWFSHP